MTLLGIIGPFQIIIFLLIIPFMVVPIIALIDIIRSDFKGENDKLIWIIIVVFTWILGAILYYILGQQQKIKRQ